MPTFGGVLTLDRLPAGVKKYTDDCRTVQTTRGHPRKGSRLIWLAWGMPKKLFQEMTQQSSDKVLLLDAGRLKTLGLDGSDPAYEQWMRAN